MEENKGDKNMDFFWYFVRSQRCCGWLQYNGFTLKGMEPNRNNPNWNVFRFKNSPELRACIDQYRQLDK